MTIGGCAACTAGLDAVAAEGGGLARRDITLDLLRRYDRPGPRYTSYPTAVQFDERFDEAAYRGRLARAGTAPDAPLSLYVHLPFCQERCTFCGCSVIITKKREVAAKYLEYLHREIALVAELLGGRRTVIQHHWGGGTPSYLTPDQMRELFAVITTHFDVRPDGEIALEVDPRVTTPEQLETLRDLGFNRLSMGVQDFTPAVQQAVNRIQGEAETRALVEHARRLGYESINIDLIYGLPLQTRRTFAGTVDAVLALRPDRAAVYSFAHVPWIRGNQKRIDPADLPDAEHKLELFVEAMERFLAAGYRQIGMDHFALPGDELARAAAAGTLHRNFMGYTTRPAPDMIGVGVSSIGEVAHAFAQNTKKLSTYYAALDAGRLPVERGYALDDDDRLRQQVIARLMCRFRLDTREVGAAFGVDFDSYFAAELSELDAGPVAHGFVERRPGFIFVTPRGQLFVRNVAMIFDRYLRVKTGAAPVFSRTI